MWLKYTCTLVSWHGWKCLCSSRDGRKERLFLGKVKREKKKMPFSLHNLPPMHWGDFLAAKSVISNFQQQSTQSTPLSSHYKGLSLIRMTHCVLMQQLCSHTTTQAKYKLHFHTTNLQQQICFEGNSLWLCFLLTKWGNVVNVSIWQVRSLTTYLISCLLKFQILQQYPLVVTTAFLWSFVVGFWHSQHLVMVGEGSLSCFNTE